MAAWTVLLRPPKLSYAGWNWRRAGIPATGTEHPTTAQLPSVEDRNCWCVCTYMHIQQNSSEILLPRLARNLCAQ